MQETILNILKDLHPELDFLDSTVNFVTDGYLDSFDVVQLIAGLEGEFKISISALDLVPENFETLAAIESLVKKYQ